MIADVIRGVIGFDGLLISDDLCMRALAGTPGERARAALAAGCDVVLHCNGDLAEMRAGGRSLPAADAGCRGARLARALAMRRRRSRSMSTTAIARLAALLGAQAIA